MSEIVWEEPPPVTREGRKIGSAARFVEALKQRPGEWAVYRPDAPYPSAGQVLRTYGADTAARRNDDGTYRIYARWPEGGDAQ